MGRSITSIAEPRHPIRALLLALALLTAALTHSQSSFANGPFAVEARPTVADAHGGRVVWSHYDPAVSGYVLMTRFNGVNGIVPIPAHGAPFDVDLGPDEEGDTVAVYSRCSSATLLQILPRAQEANPERCDVYRFDFSTGSEAKVPNAAIEGRSEYLPSIWRNRIAFAGYCYRPQCRPGDRRPAVFVGSLEGQSRPRRVRGGPFGVTPNSGPRFVELSGRRLAFTWDYVRDVNRGESFTRSQLRLAGRGGRSRLLFRSGSGNLSTSQLLSPQFDGQELYFARWSTEVPNQFLRYVLGTGRIFQAQSPRGLLSAVWDGDGFVLAQSGRSYSYGTECEDPLHPGVRQSCQLESSGPVTFEFFRRRRP